MMRLRRNSLGSIALLTASAACVGNIGGEGEEDPGSSDQALCEGVQPGATYARRLTKVQYESTIRDVFGATIDTGSTFPETNISQGFRTSMAANVVTSDGAEGIEASAMRVSQQVTSDLAGFVGCDVAAEGDPCLREFVERLGERLFRRPLDQDESDRFIALYDTILATEGATARHGIEAIVQGMLQSPQFLYLAEIGDPATPGLLAGFRFYAEQFARLLTKLQSFETSAGTLLDETMVMWTSEFGNGYGHNTQRIPFLFRGNCPSGGTGRFLQRGAPGTWADGPYTQNHVYTSVLRAFGFEDARFGRQGLDYDDSGALPGLG
jgi:hypothetical protein